MNFAYLLVPAGLALIGVPAAVLSSVKLKEKMRQPARRHEAGLGSIMRAPINWIDLVRAAAGAWMIQHALPTNVAGQDDLTLAYQAVQLTVFSLAIILQVVWLDRQLRVIGPLFFLGGLSFVLCGPLVAGLSLALGLGCALMLQRLRLIFLLAPVCFLGFGYLFGQLDSMVLLMAAGFALPAFISFALGVRIAFARRPVEGVIRIGNYSGPYADYTVPYRSSDRDVVITTDFRAEPIKIAR